MQERCNSIANALELRLSCTNPLKWSHHEKPLQCYVLCIMSQWGTLQINLHGDCMLAASYTKATADTSYTKNIIPLQELTKLTQSVSLTVSAKIERRYGFYNAEIWTISFKILIMFLLFTYICLLPNLWESSTKGHGVLFHYIKMRLQIICILYI